VRPCQPLFTPFRLCNLTTTVVTVVASSNFIEFHTHRPFPVHLDQCCPLVTGQPPKFCHSFLPVCLRTLITCLLIFLIFHPSTPISLVPPAVVRRFVYPPFLSGSDCPPAYRPTRDLRPFSTGYITHVLCSHPILPSSLLSFLSVFCNSCAYSADVLVIEPEDTLLAHI
jgi:hypothetical protein